MLKYLIARSLKILKAFLSELRSKSKGKTFLSKSRTRTRLYFFVLQTLWKSRPSHIW